MFLSVNPYTGERVGEYAKQSAAEVEHALVMAAKAWRHQAAAPIALRCQVLSRAAALLRSERQALAKLVTQEMGKPIRQALAEVDKCAWVCDYYAEQAERLLQPEAVPIEGAAGSGIYYQPLGAVLLIMPWNFPLWQVFRCAAPLMAAGNTVLLKHAPNVMGCALAVQDLLLRAGAEPGVFAALMVDTDTVPAILKNRTIVGVSLTGSTGAGAAVAELAGRHLKKVVLELGGSDAFIVLDDADVPAAATAAVASRMQNTGQTCIAAKRFIVQQSIASDFCEAVKQEYARLRLGDPMLPETDLSVLARPDLAQTLQRQVQASVQRGAQLLVGGGLQGDHPSRFAPVLLAQAPKHSPAYEEELFGPVATVWSVEDDTEALLLADDTPFGLGASVWSSDAERARRLALQLRAGVVAVNQSVRSDPRLPFGGVGDSGIGRELGSAGIREFTLIKTLFGN